MNLHRGLRDSGERSLFLLLKEVSGIGPRLALNILSGMPASDLRQALREGDLARLVAIPGVGKKTAERMILELREKVARLAEAIPARDDGVTTVAANAVSALVNLGYRRPEAERAVETAVRGGRATFEWQEGVAEHFEGADVSALERRLAQQARDAAAWPPETSHDVAHARLEWFLRRFGTPVSPATSRRSSSWTPPATLSRIAGK